MSETNGATPLNNNDLSEQQLKRLEELIGNASMMRMEIFKQLLNPGRDIDSECGFPSGFVPSDLYQDLFEREAVAARIVEILPKESWQIQPEIYEVEDPDKTTEFEQAWKDLGKTLRGEKSWYQDQEGSPIWEWILRADIESGIGQFGVILLGFDDGMDYSTPIGGAMDDSSLEIPGRVPEGGSALKTSTGLPAGEPPSPIYGTGKGSGKNSKGSKGSGKGSDKGSNTSSGTSTSKGSGVYGRPVSPPGQSPPFSTGASPEGMQPDGRRVYPVGETPYQSSNNPNSNPYSGLDSSVKGTDRQYIGVPTDPGTIGLPLPQKRDGTRLLFLRVFPEVLVQVVQFESNIRSKRFGMPVRYMITFNDPRLHEYTGVGLPIATVYVHWTRIIHLADNLQSSEVFGVPRMRPVVNNVLNIRKMSAAGPEGYWKSCFAGLALSTHPQLGGEVKINQERIRDMVDEYQQGLRRALLLMGMSASTIAPSIVDPTAHINIQIQLICIQLGIPLRIFQGSERGNLASGQDDSTWNDRLRQRQQFYLTPKVIIPLIDRLILVGCLPEPEGYTVYWPDIDTASDSDKANLANTKTTAMGAYVSQNVSTLITPLDYLTHIMGFDQDEAQSIMDDTEKHTQDTQAKQADQQQQQHETAISQAQDKIKAGVVPNPNPPDTSTGGAVAGQTQPGDQSQPSTGTTSGIPTPGGKGTTGQSGSPKPSQASIKDLTSPGVPTSPGPNRPAPNPTGSTVSKGGKPVTDKTTGQPGTSGANPAQDKTKSNTASIKDLTGNSIMNALRRERRIINANPNRDSKGKFTTGYEHLTPPELTAKRSELERSIKQERSAINTENPHRDLRSSVAHSNAKTLEIELAKVELEHAIKSGDKQTEKFHRKRLKNMLN